MKRRRSNEKMFVLGGEMGFRYGSSAASADEHVSLLTMNVGKIYIFLCGIGNKTPSWLTCQEFQSAQVHHFDRPDIWSCILFKGHDAWQKKCSLTERYNAFAYILNTDNTHLRPGCGSLNLLTSGPVSFQLQPLVFEMQNNPPPPEDDFVVC